MNNIYPSSFPNGETVSSRTIGMVLLRPLFYFFMIALFALFITNLPVVTPIGYQISGSQSLQINTSTNGCSVAMKPRARARRGQATDPHSIAERVCDLFAVVM